MQIPSGVFTKYAEVADLMLTTSVFGTVCKLVYAETLTSISSVPTAKQKRVMDPNTAGATSGFGIGSTSFKTVETTENITLRVYWSQKDFKKLSNVQIPEGGVMAIGDLSDLNNINKAKALIIYSANTNHQEWRFEKLAEPTMHGLNSNYLMTYWKRI